MLLCARAAQPQTAASIRQQLRDLTIDPASALLVRDVRLRRGDVSIYLNDGMIAFAKPVAGHVVAAVFTTEGVEAGDAEIIVMPAQPAERASLASFTNSPNLDAHFGTAVFFFTDSTADEIRRSGTRSAEAVAMKLESQLDMAVRSPGGDLSTEVIAGLLDDHAPGEGVFLTTLLNRELGAVTFLHRPGEFETVTLGSIKKNAFETWTTYRPRSDGPYLPPKQSIADYSIAATIEPDFALSSIARFRYTAQPGDGRVIRLELSSRLQIESATVDGRAAEFVQADSTANPQPVLVVVPEAFVPGTAHTVEVHYHGAVIRRVSATAFFVGDRNVWYPYRLPVLTNFDMTFRVPDRYELVSTGEPVELERIENHIRIVHQRTSVPQQLAGFNFGQFDRTAINSGPYRIECYADKSAGLGMNGIPEQTGGILAFYTKQWSELPIHSLAVTPIPGYFGQGFPGLIYLSDAAYEREQDRPAALRTQRGDSFFSEILLPHEIAHQWWGNVVTSSDYRSAWLMEAMADYSALEYIEQTRGKAEANRLLASFRDDLVPFDGKGPIDFGIRLMAIGGTPAWHAIVYEKGDWVLHMLRQRLGDDKFRQLQRKLLSEYAGKTISNEEFRAAASALLPPGQADPSLKNFFETWVYETGVPALKLEKNSVRVSGVSQDFTADIPLHCKAGTYWMPLAEGDNPIPRRAGLGCRLPSQEEYLYKTP